MKKTVVFFVILAICFSCFAIGIRKEAEKHEFDSDAMLEKFFSIPEKPEASWDDVKISVLTLSKGNELYSWFGHCGILVEGYYSTDIFYDYGRFAFSSAFYINFIKGVLWYKCGGFSANAEIQRAIEASRTISKLELDLSAEQKEAVVNFLKTNTSKNYNEYLYHHFNDNCATRIRDILNYATGGDFEAWAKSRSGYTYREQTSRILHNNIPVEWVLDFVQGPSVDEDATLWEEMFLPENLEKGLLEYGKITAKHSYVADFRETDTRPQNYEEPQPYVAQALYTGLILALSLLITYVFWPQFFVAENSVINGILAIFGSILFYMMFFSGHSFAWNNENILFINPILFFSFVAGFKYRKNRKALSVVYGTLTAVTAAMIVIKLTSPDMLEQANYPQLLAVLPIYTVNFFICLRGIV